MEASDYADLLARLRHDYIEATPKQRLHVARQRIRYPGHRPNRLVTYVAAVEAFARSLAMHAHASTTEELSALYTEYHRKGAEELITEYLTGVKVGDPSAYFGDETWRLFGFAVKFRNLLVHECTYVGDPYSTPLIDACEQVIRKLASSQGLEAWP